MQCGTKKRVTGDFFTGQFALHKIFVVSKADGDSGDFFTSSNWMLVNIMQWFWSIYLNVV